MVVAGPQTQTWHNPWTSTGCWSLDAWHQCDLQWYQKSWTLSQTLTVVGSWTQTSSSAAVWALMSPCGSVGHSGRHVPQLQHDLQTVTWPKVKARPWVFAWPLVVTGAMDIDRVPGSVGPWNQTRSYVEAQAQMSQWWNCTRSYLYNIRITQVWWMNW